MIQTKETMCSCLYIQYHNLVCGHWHVRLVAIVCSIVDWCWPRNNMHGMVQLFQLSQHVRTALVAPLVTQDYNMYVVLLYCYMHQMPKYM